ncbi:multidrug effflux MFS transporter [Lentzea sp. BCCO 10_0061]|uniref:Multidrug effflux MFS transporter n=1 Tax=Lentzea sokolovensis TaxID=3095429 RepID=A0ABU4UQV8_9PSEU|nr:multidrug effflux MFS transporter [Lentzea sp. BCCO 10_0061]MDX8141854.1 multidrug effflux MFS transporter [Lentzea sp. BCCO 10_0061]
MNSPSRSAIPVPLLLVLALLASVAPFGIDLYLPAFPRMAVELETSDTAIQLTLTMFLLGLATGQLVFGPVSDRWGRRGPLLIGSALFVAASLLAAAAPTIAILLVARLVQGVSAAAGMVIGRAIIADLVTGRAAARAFSLMMTVTGVAPVVAPLLGSLMVDGIGWRGVLFVLAGLAVAMLAGSAALVRETHPRERRGSAHGGGFRSLGRRAYLTATATFVLSFAVLMAYISASPFLYQVVIGLSPVGYGMLFALNALGLIASSTVASRLLRSRSPRQILAIGTTWLLTAAVTLLVLAVLPINAGWLVVPIFFLVPALGFIAGPATGLALDAVRGAAGTGSAVLGASQFALAAFVSPLVSVGDGHSALPMAITIAVLAALAASAYQVLARTPQVENDGNALTQRAVVTPAGGAPR